MENPQFNSEYTTGSQEAPADNGWSQLAEEMQQASQSFEDGDEQATSEPEVATETPEKSSEEQVAESSNNPESSNDTDSSNATDYPDGLESPTESESPTKSVEQPESAGQPEAVEQPETVEPKTDRFGVYEAIRANEAKQPNLAEIREHAKNVPDSQLLMEELDRIAATLEETVNQYENREQYNIRSVLQHKQAIFLECFNITWNAERDNRPVSMTDILAGIAIQNYSMNKSCLRLADNAKKQEGGLSEYPSSDEQKTKAHLEKMESFYLHQSLGYKSRGDVAKELASGEYDMLKADYARNHNLGNYHENTPNQSEPLPENSLPGDTII